MIGIRRLLRARPDNLPPLIWPASSRRGTPKLRRGQVVRALVWNVQYCAGRGQQFFYDGGASVSVDRATVDRHVGLVADVLRREDADLVLLQEVDRRSRRTARIDEHAALLAHVPYPCHVSTPYHRVAYVPFPPHEHLGRVDMHLSVFSRFELGTALRWPLALLREPWLRRQFNLRRALLEVELPLEDGGRMLVFDTHLSAFSHGDGTLTRQVGEIDRRLASAEIERTPWILGGDFNTLPPGDDPARLGAEAREYADGSQVAPLIAKYRWPAPADWAADPQPWRTYVPFGAPLPDRTIDYVFCGRAVEVLDYRVLSDVDQVSDHLPLRLDFRIRPE